MRKEQTIQQIIQQLQQLPEDKIQEVNQFITLLLKESNEKAEPQPYPLPTEKDTSSYLEEPKEVYNTKANINNRLQALSEQLKNTTDQLLIKSVQRFLHILELKQIRKNLQGKARQQGFNSEDDILASFS